MHLCLCFTLYQPDNWIVNIYFQFSYLTIHFLVCMSVAVAFAVSEAPHQSLIELDKRVSRTRICGSVWGMHKAQNTKKSYIWLVNSHWTFTIYRLFILYFLLSDTVRVCVVCAYSTIAIAPFPTTIMPIDWQSPSIKIKHKRIRVNAEDTKNKDIYKLTILLNLAHTQLMAIIFYNCRHRRI